MASKYRQRMLQNSGISNRKVQSQYAKKLMMKMGWSQGKGLGKQQHGVVDCVQVRRREQGQGLGIKGSNQQSFDWKDQWWNKTYNDSIKKLRIIPKKAQIDSSSDESSSSSDDSSSSSETPVLKSKKIKKAQKKHHKNH